MLQGIAWGNQHEYWSYFDGDVDDHRVMFDGPTKTIWILEGISEILVKEHLYSDWKEWVALLDHSKYLQAFQTEGGRPISTTERLGDSYLLINDWVIRQRDASTTVNIVGNLYAYDLNGDPKNPYEDDPDGARAITSTVSNLVNTISVGGGGGVPIDYAQIASSVWDALKAAHTQAGTMGEQMSTIPTAQNVADSVWNKPISENATVGTRGEENTLAYEESRRARAMQTNKVAITRIGSGAGAVDTINVYDDDGTTLLYTITVTGEDADNRDISYTKPY